MNDTHTSKIVPIRPHQVLKIDDGFSDELKFFMPPPRGGSVTALESVMLVKLMRCIKPGKIFEFGTYRGHTTRLLLENFPNVQNVGEGEHCIYTLDLPDLNDVGFQGSDVMLAQEALASQRKYLLSDKRHLVKQILEDSKLFDASGYAGQFQYIFIDANHEVSYVRKDTENALKMFSSSRGCIIWHDYNNPEFPELSKYLQELSNTMDLYHIEDTMMVVHLQGLHVAPKGGLKFEWELHKSR